MNDLNTVIGMHITEIDPAIDFGTSYPVVDPETLIVIDIVDGNYPQEFNDGEWETASLIGGKIVTGEHYADFAVAL